MATRATGGEGEAKGAAPVQRAGFNKEGKPYPGVDPDTGERKAVTYEGLQKEFGSVRGAELYRAIAQAGGHGRVEGNPPLKVVDIEPERQKEVDKLLAEAEKKDAEKE